MQKINILVIPSDDKGVGRVRSYSPFTTLNEQFPDQVHVDIKLQPDYNNDEFFKQYDIIHIHKTPSNKFQEGANIIKKLQTLGCKVNLDLDDHWKLDPKNNLYHMSKQYEWDKCIIANIKIADIVTVTTPYFADAVKKHNKNVYVLPNALDSREDQFTPQGTPDNGRVKFGWIGGSCFTPDTEVLTDNGWKYFQELDKQDKIATLNPKNNNIEYHFPKNYIKQFHKGEIYQCDNKNINFSVTPNHNMFISEVENLSHKKLNYELKPMEKINTDFHVKKNGNWYGEYKNTFILPQYKENISGYKNFNFIARLFENNRIINENNADDSLIKNEGEVGVITKNNNTKLKKLIKNYKNNFYLSTINRYIFYDSKELDMDEWLKFFGFWLAEGWTSQTNGLYQVGIAQSKNNNYLDEMYYILKNLGFNPTYTKNKKQLKIFNKQLWAYLSKFGKANKKYVPKYILNLDSSQLENLLDWYLKGDGHNELFYNRNRAWTVSKQLADNLQEIALKLGVSATIKNRGIKKSKIRDKEIIGNNDCYQIGFSNHPSVSKHHQQTSLVKNNEIEKKEYNGYVYCVEVPNNIMYVRRNGKPMWCGNSHLHDLQPVQGMVNRLLTYRDKIQMVLCGFDLRGKKIYIDPETGEQKERQIEPKETVWYKYEKLFTDDYKLLGNDEVYYNHLMRFDFNANFDDVDKAYRRVWTKPVNQYGESYNKFDVSLAPLENNDFNAVKSNIKVLEAGFHKKPIIAQNIPPYQIDIKHGVNGFLIDEKKNHKDWYKHAKKFVDNTNLIQEMGEALYETVKDKYDLRNVNKDRLDLLKWLVNK